MQLKRLVFVLPMGGMLPASDAVTGPAPADEGRPGSLTLELGAYTQRDHGGIEQVDEDATVFETVILAQKQLTETGTLNVRLLGDLVSAASIERTHNAEFRAQQGGASGNYRFGLGAGWSERGERLDWHAGAQVATEYAYLSTGANGGITWNLPGRNTALSVDAQVFLDTVKLIRFDGDDEGTDARDTFTVDLGWQQVLTPGDLFALTFTQTQQSGFLATSYNSVFPPSGEASEELPDSRSRSALTARWLHSLGADSSAEFGARYYSDSWGLSATTIDLRYNRYFLDRRLLLSPTYRLHLQQAADYYAEEFDDPLPTYRTSDPDLGDFTGHMAGVRAVWLRSSLFGHRADWDASVYGYDRDNGLTAFWVLFGTRVDF